VEGQEKSVELEEAEETVGEDEFSKSERKKFAEICPDFDLDTGLSYCMDSKTFLVEIMRTFKEPKKADAIQAAFDAEDWETYKISVHALKSTSRTIGAVNLSKKAEKLELAAKNDNIEEVKAEHDDLMQNYQKVREEILNWLEATA